MGRDFFTRDERQLEEEVPVPGFALADGRLCAHIDGMALRVGLILGGAVFHAQAAVNAVFRSNLNRPGIAVFPLTEFRRGGFEGLRSVLEQLTGVYLGADGGMRADEGTASALDAEVGFPDRDLEGDVAHARFFTARSPTLIPGTACSVAAKKDFFLTKGGPSTTHLRLFFVISMIHLQGIE